MMDHDYIWLEPTEETWLLGRERVWCQDDVWNGAGTKYIRVDLHEARCAELLAANNREPRGHDQPCYACGEPCNSDAGDPGLWPTMLPAEQSARPFHMKCAASIMRDAARYCWLLRQNVEALYGNCILDWDGEQSKEEDERIHGVIDANIERERKGET